MTVPIPPTDGATPVGERLGEQGGTGPDIEAPLPDLSAMAQAAQSAGEAWQAGGAQWEDSPQGAGLGGFTLTGDLPSGADGSWPADVSFPHQGPQVHPSAYIFATTALEDADVQGRRVVEVGAYNYNGSARAVIAAMGPASYLGTDMQPGPGVDLVCPAEKLPAELGDDIADVVASLEMLEHAEAWRAAVTGMVRVLAPGGLLLLTTRSPGFPYHPHPGDHWRFSVDHMDGIAEACSLEVLRLEPDPDPSQPGVFLLARKPEGWDGAGMAEGLAVVEPAPPRQMLAHFYHVYADGAWQAPLSEHLSALDVYGLGAVLDVRCAGIVGSPANCQAVIDLLGPAWQIAATAPAGYEQVTLRKLHEFAALDGKVLYAHTKGAGRPSPGSVLWRRRMTQHAVGLWERCVAGLDDGFDCAGPHWITPDRFEVPAPFFAGNFWWANLGFLRRLPPPGGPDRYAAERWIGETEIPRVLSLLPIWPTDHLQDWAAGGWWGDQP